MYYAFVAVVSLGLMGATGELCHFANDCPSRYAAFLAMNLFTFLAAAAAAVAALLNMSFVIEAVCAFLAFCSNTAAVAIITSPRTYDGDSSFGIFLFPYVLLSWACELFLIAALVHLLRGNSEHSNPKSTAETPPYKPGSVNTGAPYAPQPTTVGVPPPGPGIV